MREETSEHLRTLIKVFEFIVLPASILYLLGGMFLFKENTIDSAMWGVIVYFYSNFLPDLTCIYRRDNVVRKTRDLPWYKKYALLLLAPLFICILFSNAQFTWKTTENFHNFKSLTIYSGFLLLLGFVVFGGFPVSVGKVTETLSLPFYGIIGYLTHLKVDRML